MRKDMKSRNNICKVEVNGNSFSTQRMKKLTLSLRSKVRYTEDELNTLKKFIEENKAGYAVINENTGIARMTVVRTLKRGWAEASIAFKLRDFIQAIKQLA